MVDIRTNWYDDPGPDYDVVLATQIRLVRNIAGFPFPEYAGHEVLDALRDDTAAVISASPHLQNFIRLAPADIDAVSFARLKEAMIIPDHLTILKQPPYFSQDGRVTILTGEQDHFTLLSRQPGNAVASTHQSVSSIEQILDSSFPFAFHSRFGYLSSNLNECGSAMKCSVILHLPGLMRTSGVSVLISECGRNNIEVEGGIFPGGGDIFRISTVASWGKSEQELTGSFAALVSQLVHYERVARDRLAADGHPDTRDGIRNSLTALLNAPSLTEDEAGEYIPLVRWGISAGLVPRMSLSRVTSLLFEAREAHVKSCIPAVKDWFRYHAKDELPSMQGPATADDSGSFNGDISRARFLRYALRSVL